MVPRMGPAAGRAGTARELLPPALAALLVADAVGGLMDIAAGRSRPVDAWSSRATLCAPWPMMLAQVLLTGVATRSSGTGRRVAAALLALGCGVSVASGFFDGQLGRRDLAPGEVGFQVLLLGLTGMLGGLAAVAATD